MHLPIAPEARPPEPQKHAVHSSDSLKNYRTRRSDKLQAKLMLATSFLSEQVRDKDVCCAHVFVFSEKNTCAVVQFAAMQVLDGSCTEVSGSRACLLLEALVIAALIFSTTCKLL